MKCCFKQNSGVKKAWQIVMLGLDFMFFRILSMFKHRVDVADVVFFRLDAVGDAVLWMHSAVNYVHAYKGHRKVLVCSSSWSKLDILYDLFDEVVSIDLNKFSQDYIYHFKIIKKLNRAKYYSLVNTVFSRVFFYDMSLLFSLSARCKIGFVGDEANQSKFFRRISSSLYTELLNISDKMADLKHEFFKNSVLTSHLTGISPKLINLNAYFGSKESKHQLSDNYCVIAVGSSNKSREWGIEKYLGIVEHLNKHSDLEVVLCGDLRDVAKGERLVKSGIRVTNLIGLTTINELFRVVASASFVVSNETSSIQIAAILNVPSLCVLGGGHYGRFVPYPIELKTDKNVNLPIVVFKKMDCFGCSWNCKYVNLNTSLTPCIDGITIKEVWSCLTSSKLLF